MNRFEKWQKSIEKIFPETLHHPLTPTLVKVVLLPNNAGGSDAYRIVHHEKMRDGVYRVTCSSLDTQSVGQRNVVWKVSRRMQDDLYDRLERADKLKSRAANR